MSSICDDMMQGGSAWRAEPLGRSQNGMGVVLTDEPAMDGTVSVDGGKTWHAAHFVGPDLGRFAWRQFALHVKIPAGNYVMVSRATDAAGNVQPEHRLENQSGYSNNSWADHGVKVTVA